jgi:hypothetical protein
MVPATAASMIVGLLKVRQLKGRRQRWPVPTG